MRIILRALDLLQSAATKSIPIEAVHGMVASAHPLRSETGVNVLEASGNIETDAHQGS